VRLKFCGAAQTVTGSSFLVSVADRHILIDCGLYQGSKALQERNYGPFPFSPNEIDAVVLTHAHIDHSGLLPKLVQAGLPRPHLRHSEPTKDLCSRLCWPTAPHIQESEVERKNRKLARQDKPLLTPNLHRGGCPCDHGSSSRPSTTTAGSPFSLRTSVAVLRPIRAHARLLHW
jgi:metallo-beta-lactamase family protein